MKTTIIYCNPNTGKLTRRTVRPAYRSYQAMLKASGQYAATRPSPDTVTAIYAPYVQDAYYVVKYLESKTPLDMLNELLKGLAADSQIRTATDTAGAYAATRHDLEAHAADMLGLDNTTQTQEALDKLTRSLLIDEDERDMAADLLTDIQTIAQDEDSAQAEDTADTYSTAADLVHEAIKAAPEPPTDGDFKAASKSVENLRSAAAHHTGSPWAALNAGAAALAFLDAWEAADQMYGVILAYAIRAHRRAAIRQYIRSGKAGNAMDSMSTSYRPATPEDVNTWTRAGHQTGTDYTIATKSGTKSLAYLDKTARRPAGWYWVYKSRTYRAGNSLEQMLESTDEEGNTTIDTTIIHTSNVYANNQEALEHLEDIANRAKLSDRQRQFLAEFCRAGADYKDAKAWAFDRLGIKSDDYRRKFFQRFRESMAQGLHIEQTCQTPAEYYERTTAYWERMQSDSHRGTVIDRTPRPDLVGAVTNTRTPDPAPVISWQGKGYMVEHDTMTAWATSKAWEHSHIDNTTPEAQEAAQKAAKAYQDKQTAKAQEKAHRDAQKAAQDHAEQVKAQAIRLDVATLHTNFKMWQRWTEEQRQIHKEWLEIVTG